MGEAQSSRFDAKRVRFAEQVIENAGIVDFETEQVLLSAFSMTKREDFLPDEVTPHALKDVDLPIGFKQTSLKPSKIARMMGLVGICKHMKILEIGLGSGFSAAVMSATGANVYGIEEVGPLAQETRKRLDSLGYQNILLRNVDGSKGWNEHAPYDAIIVHFAINSEPDLLLKQLKNPGGRLVAPIGKGADADLYLYEHGERGLNKYKLEKWNN